MFWRRRNQSFRHALSPSDTPTVKPRRKTWKIVFVVILLIIIGLTSWVGYSGWDAIKRITAGAKNNSFFNLLTNPGASKLNGEDAGRVNILLMGIGGDNHPGGQLADSIMVVSLKPSDHTAAFISVPRDLYVQIPGHGYDKINAAQSIGEGNSTTSTGGPELLSQTVQQVLGIPIQYYVRADFTGFKDLVDAVGGITVNVPNDLYDPLYPAPNMVGYSTFTISKGVHNMNGDTALKYARSRETTSDFDRAKRQQLILMAIKDKATTAGILANPKKVVDIMNVLGNHILTNLNIQEMERVVQISKDLNSSKSHQVVLDDSANGYLVSENSPTAGYILKPRTGNYSEIQQLAKTIFDTPASPTSATTEKAAIEVRNATGVSGQATSVSSSLVSLGYSSTASQTALPLANETILYDYTNGTKPFTASFLASRYNATVVKKTSVDSSSADFILILGSSYLYSTSRQ